MVIPCLYSFTALRTLAAELVGAKPLHLLTQTVLLLKRKPLINKKVPEPFFIKNRVRVRTVWWTVQDSNL